MRILGISSATKVTSIGLIEDGRVLVETTVADIHSEKVIFYINEAGIKPEQIDGVAVASGPGSYSGLRGGVTAAKSLAQTLNIPLIGISTLEAIAYNLIDIEGTMAIVLDAKANDFNFALFGASQGKLKRLTGDLVLNIDKIIEMLSKVTGELWLAGNIKEIEGKIKENQGKNFHFADDIHAHPYGINVAKLGALRFETGEKDDPLMLIPSYSHKPNIREFK